jgi:hypothetical protein
MLLGRRRRIGEVDVESVENPFRETAFTTLTTSAAANDDLYSILYE